MSDTSVDAVQGSEPSGLAKFSSSVIEQLQEQENYLSVSLKDGLKKDGDLQKMPAHMTESFRRWEETFTSPEERVLIANVKRQVVEIMNESAAYTEDAVGRKSERIQLELAVKAIAKVTQGVQQLLSSQ